MFEPHLLLLAEDHDWSRRILKLHLEKWGFEVVTASDGEEALSILESPNSPSLAVLDWMMPKIDGAQVCLRVREHTNRPYVYMLLLTARSHHVEITEGLAAGADDYVIKPFDPDELLARLKVGQRVVSLERTLARKAEDLEVTLTDVKLLKKLIPICMCCKSVRDDNDYWHAFEEYIHARVGTDFSHGVCPACMAKLVARERIEPPSQKPDIIRPTPS